MNLKTGPLVGTRIAFVGPALNGMDRLNIVASGVLSMPPSAVPANPNGFTLTEVMVTLAVIAILTFVAGPGLSSYFEKARVRNAADGLSDLLALARSESIKRDRQVAVTFGGSAMAWCAGARSAPDPAPGDMAGTAEGCNCSAGDSCLIGNDPAVVDGAMFRNVGISAVGTQVTFDGKLGTLSDLAPATITVFGPEERFRVNVHVGVTGLASLCVPEDAGFISGIPTCT